MQETPKNPSYRDSYDFYHLTNQQAAPFVGKIIKTIDGYEYLVVHWNDHSKNCNYGQEYGLIFLMKPASIVNPTSEEEELGDYYFNFGISSPDDWDCQVTFYGTKRDLYKQRKKVIKWAQAYVKNRRVSHKELFKNLIKEFNVPPGWVYMDGIGI